MRAAANEILEAASVRHGWGTVCAVLESLTAAHAVHLELVPHGMFLKAHYKKEHKDKCARDGSVPPCSSACLSMGSPSATSSNGTSLGCISRSSMLSMRCASSIEPKGSADHIRCANIFDAVDTDSSADASVGADAVVEKLGRDIVVAPSPVERDCMAVECEEAYPLQSAPGSEPILQLEPMQDGLMSRFHVLVSRHSDGDADDDDLQQLRHGSLQTEAQFVMPQSILSLKDQHILSLKDQIATLTSESESCKDAETSVLKKESNIASISNWGPRTMIPFLHQHIVTQEEIEEMNMNVVDAKGIRRQVEFVHSAPWQTDISDMEYPLKLTLVLKKVAPPIDAGSLPIPWRELRPT